MNCTFIWFRFEPIKLSTCSPRLLLYETKRQFKPMNILATYYASSAGLSYGLLNCSPAILLSVAAPNQRCLLIRRANEHP